MNIETITSILFCRTARLFGGATMILMWLNWKGMQPAFLKALMQSQWSEAATLVWAVVAAFLLLPVLFGLGDK